MEIINLEITKEFFDESVPAAKEPKGYIFNRILPFIKGHIQYMATMLLGDKGILECNNNTDGEVATLVKRAACVKAFDDNMRSLDLVITPTGFGVVSTNDTAPASKIRVDALDGELRVAYRRHMSFLLSALFKVDGWYGQGVYFIENLFYHFDFLTMFAGIQAPVSKDWEAAAPIILSQDAFLRKHISDEYMEELISEMATATVKPENVGIIHQIRRIIGLAIRGDQNSVEKYYKRLMNTLEGNLESYSTYANSEAYRLNHFEPYENKKDDSAFHFVG